jgi:Skp family chaperone for outer membrane proteins
VALLAIISENIFKPIRESLQKMNEEIEGFYKSKKDYQMEKDKKLAKKEKKRKALLEQ